MRVLALAASLSALTACSGSAFRGEGADDGSADDTGSELADSGSWDSAENPPARFALEGELSLEQGEFTGGSLRLGIYADDSSLGVQCTQERGIEDAESRVPTPDATVYHWWRLETEVDEHDCSGADRVPQEIWVGLGALHPEVVPGVVAAGLDDSQDSLYGAYAALEGPDSDDDVGTAYAYGFAGTAEDLAGETEPVDGPPMPDGSYALRAWFLFDLPVAE